MSLKQWVILKHSHPIRNNKGELITTIPAEQLGRLHEVDETGALYVCFPQAHISPQIKDLLPFQMPPVEQAINLLREFHGHHCRKDGQYQFNIKFHEFPPQKIFDKCGDERTWDFYNEVLSDQLRWFMEEDYGIINLIDWIDKKWYTAGRSGGWLVIEDVHDRSWESLADQYNTGDEDDRQAAYEDIMELALGIRYIGECIRYSKLSLADYIKSDEVWEPLLEEYGEEESSDEEDGLYQSA